MPKRLIGIVLLLSAAAFAQTVNNNILPASTGLNLGASNQRWNGFFQNLDINGACTMNGQVCFGGIGLPGVTSNGSNGIKVVGAIFNNIEFDNGTCSTAVTIDPLNGNRQKITLTNAQTCALTFTNPSAATADVRLKIIQSSAGSFNGGISGGKWPAAVIPTITQTAGAIDIISCYLDGASAFCVPSQDFR